MAVLRTISLVPSRNFVQRPGCRPGRRRRLPRSGRRRPRDLVETRTDPRAGRIEQPVGHSSAGRVFEDKIGCWWGFLRAAIYIILAYRREQKINFRVYKRTLRLIRLRCWTQHAPVQSLEPAADCILGVLWSTETVDVLRNMESHLTFSSRGRLFTNTPL